MSNQASLDTNKVKSYIPQCQVLWFPWINSDEDLSNSSLSEVDVDKLSDSDAFDISDHLDSVTFSKHMGDPAGSFTLKLDSTKDWKDAIKPGHWMVILMSQDGDLFGFESVKEGPQDTFVNDVSGNAQPFKTAPSFSDIKTEKIRTICRVDRIATNITTGSNGEFIASYSVTGRDFGCIYQDTEIWYSIYLNETNTLPAFNAYIGALKENSIQASIKFLLQFIHDLTLADSSPLQSVIEKFKQNLSLPTQWIMPKKLLKYIGQMPASGSPYYGNIENVLNFKFTPFSLPIINPVLYVQGKLWEKLKHYSAEPIHELFPETSDTGKMQLTFRPIPWAIDTSAYPSLAEVVDTFADLATDPVTSVNLTPIELIYLDLGEDDHSRYNHFLLEATPFFTQGTSSIAQLSKPSKKGRQFPLVNAPSVSRNGFRPMHINLETFFIGFTENNPSGDKRNNPISTDYLLQSNELAFDYWNKFVFFESGGLTIFGKNDVKIGKVLTLDDTFPYNPGAYYYLEGYEDEFTIDEKGAGTWIQHLYVTHGVEANKLDDGGNNKRFGRRSNTFNKESSFIKKNG